MPMAGKSVIDAPVVCRTRHFRSDSVSTRRPSAVARRMATPPASSAASDNPAFCNHRAHIPHLISAQTRAHSNVRRAGPKRLIAPRSWPSFSVSCSVRLAAARSSLSACPSSTSPSLLRMARARRNVRIQAKHRVGRAQLDQFAHLSRLHRQRRSAPPAAAVCRAPPTLRSPMFTCQSSSENFSASKSELLVSLGRLRLLPGVLGASCALPSASRRWHFPAG